MRQIGVRSSQDEVTLLKKLDTKELAQELVKRKMVRDVEIAPGRKDFWTRLGGRSAQLLVTDGVDAPAPSVGVGRKEIMSHHISHASFVLIIERSKKGHRWEILYLCFTHKDKLNARSFTHELRNFNIIDGHHSHRYLEQLITKLL